MNRIHTVIQRQDGSILIMKFHFIPSFGNSVEPDQLASSEASLTKPADQDLHCFTYIRLININNDIVALDWLEIR